jgi:hypothetical protein
MKTLREVDQRSASLGSYWKLLLIFSPMIFNVGRQLGSGNSFSLETTQCKDLKNTANLRLRQAVSFLIKE